MNPPFTLGVPIHRDRKLAVIAASAGICFAPLSIAISEILLGVALLARITRTASQQASQPFRRIITFWIAWAAIEIVSWQQSPDRAAGSGELRHLLLIAGLFLILPAFSRLRDHLTVWKGLFLTSTIGAAAVIITFVARLLQYRATINAGGDAAFYLRNGGLLHHWMIFAVVEAMIFGGLLEYRACYPSDRRWTTPAVIIHSAAIICSLTRGLWIACLVLLAIHLVWQRSKAVWILLVIPAFALLLAFAPVRQRLEQSFEPDYSSNLERVQMVRVGWKMIREHPWTGVGPGRVEKLYPKYLEHGEPLPTYHGHLHNNAIQLAAEFGVPVLLAAILFVAALFTELWKTSGAGVPACQPCAADSRFLARAALLGVAGFLLTGMTDYTYGHSLGLILFSYVSLAPLLVETDFQPLAPKGRDTAEPVRYY